MRKVNGEMQKSIRLTILRIGIGLCSLGMFIGLIAFIIDWIRHPSSSLGETLFGIIFIPLSLLFNGSLYFLPYYTYFYVTKRTDSLLMLLLPPIFFCLTQWFMLMRLLLGLERDPFFFFGVSILTLLALAFGFGIAFLIEKITSVK